MLVDNHSSDTKVHHWIDKYINEGEFSLVTGYFTIGALVYFSKICNEKITDYKFVLGDITQRDSNQVKSLDLLNADLSIESALKLKNLARQAVAFLKLESVSIKTLEPNFCHAKLYLFKSAENNVQKDFYITGSSNLTEAGIGLKESANIELNIANFGADSQFKDLEIWFKDLWINKKAFDEKITINADGKESKIPFKQYLIEEISKLFQDYLPKDIYYKILFELFSQDILIDIDNPEFAKKIGRLENTEVYQALYEFQKKGAISLIKKLDKYDGAILADAVGLGKTWSALAVMKYYQNAGREIVLFCPKKLEDNWRKYRKDQDSRFERDELEYSIRYHTDLVDTLMGKDEYLKERKDINFKNKKPKLFVIDESHNLRNDKSNRFIYLLEEMIKKNEDIKILLLSATPINNSFKDVRNQVKLISKDNNNAFDESLDVKNLHGLFSTASRHFNDWQKKDKSPVKELVSKMDDSFFRLTDALLVARTRKMIVGQQNDLFFPQKHKPENKYVTPKVMENVDSLEDLLKLFPPMLCGYQPIRYTMTAKEKEIRTKKINKGNREVDVLDDEVQRDMFLVKMMYILLLKRLESSWFSFESTVNKILNHHQNALDKVELFKENKDEKLAEGFNLNDFDEEDFEDLTLGKREISITEIFKSGNLDMFERDLKRDIKAMKKMADGMEIFSKSIDAELNNKNLKESADIKLENLISVIDAKRENKKNGGNPKVLIFTSYTDTANYLYKHLNKRGFKNIAMVSGAGAKINGQEEIIKRFEPVLESFAPFTKLFMERKWDHFLTESKSLDKQFKEWKKWVSAEDGKVANQLKNPIDILIATDTLSEGQNLQDCDMVINYDIHWNPVRTIQRVGRIDRLGSPNKEIFTVNFWPTQNLNEYLNLQSRIEKRMMAMKLMGSEDIKDFTEHYANMSVDEELETRHTDRMLEQMQNSVDDLDGEKSFGFDDLSLETFRQDLASELNERREHYENLPNAIFSGVKHQSLEILKDGKGLISLLGSPPKDPKDKLPYKNLRLIHINEDGDELLLNDKEILQYLNAVKDEERYGCKKLDIGDKSEVKKYSDALAKWFESQSTETEINADGTQTKTAGKESISVLDKIKKAKKEGISTIKDNVKISEKYDSKNWDLIAWLTVNK